MPDTALTIVWVAVGAAIGGPLRFLISILMARHFGEDFPFGTILVNVVGSFLIGVMGALAIAHPDAAGLPWAFGVTGLLGSFTTVSSFALQTYGLIEEHAYLRAGLNIFLSLAGCMIAVALGFLAGAS